MRALTSSRLVAAIPAAALWCAAVSATPQAQPTLSTPAVAAAWMPRHVQFVYRGSTSLYSCRGLQNEIAHLLTRLGARDLRVEACGVLDRPILFPSVRVTMRVLVPAGQGNGGPSVAAHWRKVRPFPEMAESGSCELIGEFRHTFLPLFAARNIEMDATCVPHHHTPENHLSAEVLAADSSATRPR